MQYSCTKDPLRRFLWSDVMDAMTSMSDSLISISPRLLCSVPPSPPPVGASTEGGAAPTPDGTGGGGSGGMPAPASAALVVPVHAPAAQCTGKTKAGEQCKRSPSKGMATCHQHMAAPAPAPAPAANDQQVTVCMNVRAHVPCVC